MDKSKIEAARAALQHMDDFAMMSCAVDPVGPRSVLEQFIFEVERLAGTDAVYMDMVPVAGAQGVSGDDLLDRLQHAIDEAEHKPGQWAKSFMTMGGIMTAETVLSARLQPDRSWGSFSYKRDAWLAIAAVNALPELMDRLRRTEQGERAADQEVERLRAELDRLRATLPATTTCCGDPGDCAQPCEAERKPSAKTARALEQAREIRERLAGDELPDGLSWDQAPWWATVLVRHLDGQHAWAAAYANGAKADAADGDGAVTRLGAISEYWTLIATRPTQKAPCTDCGACVGGPHGCGKPGLHGKAEPADDGWIEWEGGECPVAEGTLVDVKQFYGAVKHGARALELGAAADWSNNHPEHPGNIIAYRLHRPATPRRDATQN